jgi:ribonuclease HI
MKTIWVDGSGWNGRRSGYAICDSTGKNMVVWDDTHRTNNQAEYEALVKALDEFVILEDTILSDSQLVVNQVNGLWKVKNQKLYHQCLFCQDQIKATRSVLRWIPREENKAGFLLEGK